MVTFPVNVPVPVGAKETVMVQLLLAARLDPQVLVCMYFVGTVMLVMLTLDVPLLVIVTFCGGLVVLMTWFEKVSLVGDNVTVEAAKEKSGRLTRTQANKTARFTSASGGTGGPERVMHRLGG